MILELKENKSHGTKEYPYEQYYIKKVKHAFQFPVHWHDEVEIIYVRKGRLHVMINEQEYCGTDGSIFLVNPRELHLMGSDDLEVAYYTLLFPLEFISFQSMDDLESDLLQPLRSGQLLFMNEITGEELKKALGCLIEEIVAVNEREDSSKQLCTRIRLLQLLQKLVEHHAVILPAASSGTGIQREMLAYIQAHYTEKITLQQLGENFHLSEKYISRYFKEHFYLTFSSYVNHLRLSHAKKLLEGTELPITEVAFLSGFSGVSYFIRTFKESCGISPLKYRKSAVLLQKL